MIRVAKPLSGHEFKMEVVMQAIAWGFFGESDPHAEENGFVDVDPLDMERIRKTADQVLAALYEFKED